MNEELKPCPFCGKEAFIFERACGDSLNDIFFEIGCKTYECIMEEGSDFICDTKEESIEAWNKRV